MSDLELTYVDLTFDEVITILADLANQPATLAHFRLFTINIQGEHHIIPEE